jgi:hypothetical protein
MGRFILGLVLAASAYGIVSCTIKDREKREARENQEAQANIKDALLISLIKEKKKEFNADLSWIEKFGMIGERKEGFVKLYTTQIQEAFLNEKDILIFGEIKDFSNLNASEYELIVSLTPFALEMMTFIKPKLKFKFTCPKDKIDSVISEFNASYKKRIGFGINVAVIGKISSIEDHSENNSEGQRENGKTIIGDCIEVLLAPQKFGAIRENIESL